MQLLRKWLRPHVNDTRNRRRRLVAAIGLRPLLFAICCAGLGAVGSAATEPVQGKPDFKIAPTFSPPQDKWDRADSVESLGQPVTYWAYKERPDFRVIHYITQQSKEPGDSWDGLLKKTCSLMLPQLSAALATNVSPPKQTHIGTLPGCMVKIEAKDKSITEHYVFIWNTDEDRARGKYQGHTITVSYPANYLAQGHEALEKFMESMKVPGISQDPAK